LSELAKSSLHCFGDSCPVFDPDGNLLPQAEADKLQESLWKVVEQATEYSKEHKATIPAHESLYDYGVLKAEEMFGPSPPPPEESSDNATDENERPTGPRTESTGRIRWKGQEQRKEVGLSQLCDIHSCLFDAAFLVTASHVGLVHRLQCHAAKFEVLSSGRACGRA
jgi:hypothetical protein